MPKCYLAHETPVLLHPLSEVKSRCDRNYEDANHVRISDFLGNGHKPYLWRTQTHRMISSMKAETGTHQMIF